MSLSSFLVCLIPKIDLWFFMCYDMHSFCQLLRSHCSCLQEVHLCNSVQIVLFNGKLYSPRHLFVKTSEFKITDNISAFLQVQENNIKFILKSIIYCLHLLSLAFLRSSWITWISFELACMGFAMSLSMQRHSLNFSYFFCMKIKLSKMYDLMHYEVYYIP